MKIANLFLFFAVLLLFSSCSKEPDQIVSPSNPGYGRSIYIDPLNGNDENNGREFSSPVKTLFKASAFAASGDTLYFKGGVYPGFKDVIVRTSAELGYIFIRPYPGQTVALDGTGGTYSETEAILTIKNSTYVDISGFEIRNNSSGRGVNIFSDSKYSNFMKFTNCTFHDLGSAAINFGCSNFVLQNCEIYNTCLNNRNRALGDNGQWPAAIQTYFQYNIIYLFPNAEYTWTGTIISNNKIYDNWGEGLKLSRASEYKITSNKIYNCYNAAMILDNSRMGLVFNNFIYTTGDEYNRISSGYNRPMQGVILSNKKNEFVANPISENILIFNNLLVRTSSVFSWFYDASNAIPTNTYFKVKIIFNTSFNTIGYESFAIDPNYFSARYPPSENEFKNNIIYKPVYNSVNQNYFTASGDYAQYWAITNNCFASGDIPSFVSAVNIAGNPSFLNSAAMSPEGFKLANNSICKRTGIMVSSVAQDYFLNLRSSSPSIGFYELLK